MPVLQWWMRLVGSFAGAIRGVVGMLYYIGRGAPVSLYGPLALAHLFIVGSGIGFARRAMRESV
jgi:hypothetical protein